MSLLCAVLKDLQQNLDLGKVFSEMVLQGSLLSRQLLYKTGLWGVRASKIQDENNSFPFFCIFKHLFIYYFYLWEGNSDSKLARGTDAWRKVFCHLNFTNLELRGLLLLLSFYSKDRLCSNYNFLISAQELQNEILWVLSGRMLLQYTVGRRRVGGQQENVGQIQRSRC